MKKFLELLKKDLYKTIIIDLVMFTLIFGFFYLIRQRVVEALNRVQELTPQLSQLEGVLQQGQDPASLTQLSQIITQLNHETKIALFLGMVLLPLGIYLIFSLAHAIEYLLLQKKKITLKDIGKYLLYTIPLAVIFGLAMKELLLFLAPIRQTFEVEPAMNAWLLILALLVLLISFIVLTVGYSREIKLNIFKSYWDNIKLSLKKYYHAIPYGIIVLVGYLILLFYFFQGYVSVISQTKFELNYLMIIIVLIIMGLTKIGYTELLLRRPN